VRKQRPAPDLKPGCRHPPPETQVFPANYLNFSLLSPVAEQHQADQHHRKHFRFRQFRHVRRRNDDIEAGCGSQVGYLGVRHGAGMRRR